MGEAFFKQSYTEDFLRLGACLVFWLIPDLLRFDHDKVMLATFGT